jgi:DNA mismatch repair ATPase MutS
MITKPTTAQLIDEVRRTLASTVAPAINDPQVQASLQMIDHILSTLAIRAENELAWMLEEIDDIEHVMGRVAEELPDAGAVLQALDALRTTPDGSRSVNDITQRYALASEALSCAVEATMSTGGPLRDEVSALLDRRLARETEVIGEFQLVARG